MSVLEVVEVNSDNNKGLLEVPLSELRTSYRNLRIDLDFGRYYNCLVSAPMKWYNGHEEYIQDLIDSGKMLAMYNYLLSQLKSSLDDMLNEAKLLGGLTELVEVAFTEQTIATRIVYVEGHPLSARKCLGIMDIIRLYFMCTDLEIIAHGCIDVSDPPEFFSEIDIYKGKFWVVEHPISKNPILVSNDANVDLEALGVPLITLGVRPVDIDDILEDRDVWSDRDDIIKILLEIIEYCKEE